LKLIHEDVLIPAGIFLTHFGVFFEKYGCPKEQVVKINCIAIYKELLIAFIGALYNLIAIGLKRVIIR
jgi:hypothetical protein